MGCRHLLTGIGTDSPKDERIDQEFVFENFLSTRWFSFDQQFARMRRRKKNIFHSRESSMFEMRTNQPEDGASSTGMFPMIVHSSIHPASEYVALLRILLFRVVLCNGQFIG